MAAAASGPIRSGKAVSKLNALKHGLLSQTVVVRGYKIKESPAAFRKLCQKFYADLQPVGPLEEMLVGQIVTATWRLRRARTAESGEIALNVDEGYLKRRRINPQLQWAEWEVWGDPVWAMKESHMGTSILAGWLSEVRKQVEQDGELTEAAIKIPFHGKPNRLAVDLEKLRQRCLLPPPAGTDAARHREEIKKQVLAHIDREMRILEWGRDDCWQRENAEEQARQAAAVLPAPAVLEKILRYETALERQIFRAMHELERLQRRRRGEKIPRAHGHGDFHADRNMKITKRTQNGDAKTAVNWGLAGGGRKLRRQTKPMGAGLLKRVSTWSKPVKTFHA